MVGNNLNGNNTKKMNQKFRVKIPCYHYNTGNADNFSYIANVDFDNYLEAYAFADKVSEQYQMTHALENHLISYEVYKKWETKFKPHWFEVEDGFVTGEPTLVHFIPEQENKIEFIPKKYL